MVFHWVRKQKTGTISLDDPEVLKNIKIVFRQASIDYDKDGIVKYVDYPARQCKREDIGPGKEAEQIWKAWEKYKTICPDFQAGETFIL